MCYHTLSNILQEEEDWDFALLPILAGHRNLDLSQDMIIVW